MAISRQVGQLFTFGIEGTEPEPLRPMIESLMPNGVILFRHNIISKDQVQHLTGGLQDFAGRAGIPPLLISADQEGGRVVRLVESICPQYPSNWELGDAYGVSGDATPVSTQGKETASVLRSVGINMNLAPVMDVVTVEGNTVIADRAYGAEPGVVARLGVEYITALQGAGVIATAKHYPGHGPTDVDSHYGLPFVTLQDPELREVHLAPFIAAIKAGVDAIMPAHIIYEAWDEWPATLSKKLCTELLRDELGFKGVVISDDLNMHAISKHYPFPASMVQAVNAGVDILLVCFEPDVQRAAWQTVHDAVQDGELSEQTLDQALGRIAGLKQKYITGEGGAN